MWEDGGCEAPSYPIGRMMVLRGTGSAMKSKAGKIEYVDLEYVDLKRSVYREYSRPADEVLPVFVSGAALAQCIDWALETRSKTPVLIC